MNSGGLQWIKASVEKSIRSMRKRKSHFSRRLPFSFLYNSHGSNMTKIMAVAAAVAAAKHTYVNEHNRRCSF
jgi:hypothetical protein